MPTKLQTSSGKVSTILLVLGAMLIVLIVGIFIFLRINALKNSADSQNNSNDQTQNEPPKPVYETQIGDVRFVFLSAIDKGSVLQSQNSGYQQPLTTTERFIQVTVGAQNKGKVNLQQGSWDIGNIVDSEGRNFVSINNQAYFYLPLSNACQNLLKPEFQPSPCIKLYEVSRESKGLKIQVMTSGPGVSKGSEELLDLLIQ